MGAPSHRGDSPEGGRAVEAGVDDLAREERTEGEVGRVSVEVVEEVVPGKVLREVIREGEVGELAEDLREVQVEAVVGVVSPQAGDAIRLLDDDRRDRELVERGGDGEARRPGADHDRAISIMH